MFTLKNAFVAILALAGIVATVPVNDPESVTINATDGACPDNNASFDFMIQFWQDESVEHNLMVHLQIRVNRLRSMRLYHV
ncbi:hypothetical protein VC83_04171 [Pseudogymnoascus destructans]|uniref:Uncharacterized protein n=1 Tax=Pseudogymnoascus destructans TaxID=655981 RepID=A0A177AD82_9PEZI|nr:uncharacterized protein VC83_04171 [Pseudogymnoascus destructans]OAF59134.1 hypothetical protein VC83_04171 [Pseudogymnoascus destructans]